MNLVYTLHEGCLEVTANTIPLAKIAELRQTQRKYGLKTGEDYKKVKQTFLASKNPGQ